MFRRYSFSIHTRGIRFFPNYITDEILLAKNFIT